MHTELTQLQGRHESLVRAAQNLTWSMEHLLQEDVGFSTAGLNWSLGASRQQLEQDLRRLTSDLEGILPQTAVSPAFLDCHAEARALAAMGSAAERLTTARKLLIEKEERCRLLLEQVRSW
jgi:hypothetical protein